MLLITLAVVALLSLAVGAAIELTGTASAVAATVPRGQDSIRETDGALNFAMNLVLTDPAAMSPTDTAYSCTGFDFSSLLLQQPTFKDITGVTCSAVSPGIPQARDLTIAVQAGGRVLGRVRVLIQDTFRQSRAVGTSTRVCDWQVGAAVSTPLNSCG